MQIAVRKAIRVGRATMLTIGIGVFPALVRGAATVALAAVPGDPFRLGQVNSINNATTVLRGDFAGGGSNLSKPTLEVGGASSPHPHHEQQEGKNRR
jgi:hypothetical protein